MPYIKYESRKEENKRVILTCDKRVGLVSCLNDPELGLIWFVSREDVHLLDDAGVKYSVIPKEKVTAPYPRLLKKRYPEYADQL